jgi:protein involved in polysaccharide export with SLBB domain
MNPVLLMFHKLTSKQNLLICFFAMLLHQGIAWGQSQAPNPEFAPGAASSVGGDYVLRSNDLIAVTVFGEPDLAAQDRLSADGSVMLPLLGRVKISGRTAAGAAETIRQLLATDYLVSPQVNVSVVEHTKDYFTILGQVSSPGAYVLPPTGKLPFLQAIGMAGGFTRIASQSKITVKRKVSGREQVIKVDGKKLANDRNEASFEILPGDVVIVGESLF